MKKHITKILAIAFFFCAFEFNVQAQDMGVAALVDPTSPLCATDKQVLTVTIENFNASDIDFSTNPTDVVVDITGTITQSFIVTVNTGTLVAGGSQDVVVTTGANFVVAGPYDVDAHTVVAGDANSSNDAMTTVNITVNAVPVVNLGSDITQCGGTVILDAGNVGSTYVWLDASTNQTYTAISTGTYSVVVTDANTCTGEGTINVTIESSPVVDLGADVTQCAGTVMLDAGNIGSTYEWSDASVNQTFTASATGTYWVIATNSCSSDTDSVMVTINTPPTVSLGSDVTQCGGTVILDAGNVGSTYAWSDLTTTTQTFTVSATGTYSVVVTDANTCTGEGTIDVTIGTAPTVSLGADVTQCGAVTLDAGNSGSTYVWSDASTNQTLSASSTGTYSVVVTDVNGCTNSDTVDVTINTPPTVSLGSDVTQCGGTVILDAGNSGSTYVWSDLSTNQTFTASATGTYSVVVTDANTCTGEGTINVTIGTAPTVSLGADVTQCGAVTLDAGNSGSTYVWSDASTNQTLSASSTGTYSVVVTDINGCTNSDTVDVTVNTPPTVSLGSDVTQCGGTVILDAGNAGSTYAWSDLTTTTQTFTVSSTGTYSVVVTDVNTCTGEGTINVTIGTAPTVSLGADVTQCGGTVILDAGNSGSTYVWSDLSTNQTLSASATGTYSVVVTDVNGCTSSDTVDVTVNTPPTVSLGSDVTQCGGTVILDAGNAGSTYAWSDLTTTTQTFTVSSTGTYSVVVTDANTCTGEGTINVTVETLAVVNLGSDVTQCGGTVILDAGNAGSTYEWSDASVNQTLTGSSTGTYWVIVTNSCGNDTDSVMVTINTPPVVSLGVDVTQCGGIVILDAGNAGSTYVWSDLSTNQTLSASSTGTYSVVVTDANTCTGEGTVNVTIGTAPTVSLSVTSPVCGNSDGVVDAFASGGTGPYQYAWSNTDITSSVTGLVGSPTDTLIVTVTDANGCVSAEDTAFVDCVLGIAEKNAGNDISVYPNPSNGQFQLIIGNGQLVTGNEQLSIYNMLGDKVYSTIITSHSSNLNLNVPGGIYFLQVKSENGIIVQKLTIDK